MAQIIAGKSKCRLCERVIAKHDELVAFSAFIVDLSSDLYVFSDGVFHRACFEAHPRAEKCLDAHRKMRQLFERRFRCDLCGELVEGVDDGFQLSHFPVDGFETLSRYALMNAHRSCLTQCTDAASLVSEAHAALENGAVAGGYFHTLIRLLQENDT